MGDATVTVEVGFGSDPGTGIASTVWTDITDYVEEVTIRRGRQQELDEFRAGTCTVQLKDPDGRFNPANTAGAYWPDVKPMKRLRVRASDPDDGDVYSDVYTDGYVSTYTVFSGFVDRWPQQWLLGSEMPVTVEATDGFKLFAGKGLPDSVWTHEVSESGPHWWWRFGEDSGTSVLDSGRIGADLTYVGSPTLGATGLVEHDPDTAVQFDGTGGQVFGGPAGLGLVTGDYTVEFVVNLDALTTDTSIWTFLCRLGNQFTCLIDGFTGYLFVVDKDAGAKSTSAEFGLTVGQTAHIAVTVESGTTITIYANGVDESKAAVPSGSEIKGTFNVSIGFDEFDGGSPDYTDLQGTVDEFAVYTEVLSAATIAAHAGAVTSAWNGDTSGARVGRALDLVGWPTADRDLDTGQSTFGDADLGDDETLLQYLQRCERSESGHLFITGDGKVRFIERHALITETVYATSQVTLSDAPGAGEHVYAAIDPNYDDDIVNEVTVQRKYGVDQTVTSSASQTSYLDRSLSQTGLLMDTDTEARSRAQWLLTRLKDPRIEIRRVDLEPAFETGLWVHVLGLDLMSRVTVERTPHAGADTFTQESHIQGISHTIRAPGRDAEWVTSWFLSPADAVDYLILDDASYGKLDTNALAY